MLSLVVTPDEVIFADCGTDHNDGSVLAMPRQGGAVRTLATSQGRPDRILFDGVNVYWSTTEFHPRARRLGRCGWPHSPAGTS